MGTMAKEDILSRGKTTSRNRLGLGAGEPKTTPDDAESVMVNTAYKKLLAALAEKSPDGDHAAAGAAAEETAEAAAGDDIPSLHEDIMAALDLSGDWSDVDDPFAELNGDELEWAVAALTTALDFDPVMAAKDPALRPIEDDVSDALLRSRAVSNDALAEDSLGRREKPDALTQIAAMLHADDVPVRRATIGERPLVAALPADQSLDLAKLYQTAARFTPAMPLQSRPSAQPVPQALLREHVPPPTDDNAAYNDAADTDPADETRTEGPEAPPPGGNEPVEDAAAKAAADADARPAIADHADVGDDTDADLILDTVIEQANAEPVATPLDQEAAQHVDDEETAFDAAAEVDDASAPETPAPPAPPRLIAAAMPQPAITEDDRPTRPLVIVPAEPMDDDADAAMWFDPADVDPDRDLLAEASMRSTLDDQTIPTISLRPVPVDSAPLHDRPIHDSLDDNDTSAIVQAEAPAKPASSTPAKPASSTPAARSPQHGDALDNTKPPVIPAAAAVDQKTGIKSRNPALMALTVATVLLTGGGVGLVTFHESPALRGIWGPDKNPAAPSVTAATTKPDATASVATATPAVIPPIDGITTVREAVPEVGDEPLETSDLAALADRSPSTEAPMAARGADDPARTTVAAAEPVTEPAPAEPETAATPVATDAAVNEEVASEASDETAGETTLAALPPATAASPAVAEPLRLTAPAPLPLPAELEALQTSAIQGNRQAQHDLGAHFAAGRLVDQDFERAAYWFQEAAIRGVANAQYNMGVLLQQGLGVPPDAASAVAWYRRAAENGHVEAQYNMGVAYADGIGVSRDIPKAVRWFEQAAAAGIARAAFNLGVMYEVGMVGRPDLDAARQWYRQAATSGDRDATEALARLNGTRS